MTAQNSKQNSNQSSPSTQRFISAYSPKLKVQISFTGEGRTKQSFRSECDINTIMARYQRTGVLPDMLNKSPGQYLDVTGIDYQEAMQTVATANSLFEELPSKIRSRFENDPQQFLEFTSNENNRQEMATMGLLKPEAVAAMAEAQRASEKAAEALKTSPIDKDSKNS